MSQRYPGGVITKSPTAPTQSAASGVWTLEQVAEYVKSDTWPVYIPPIYVEDVFSTYLYNGTGTTQTITNGIDLSGQGGMVWVKVRSLGDQSAVFDSARGISKSLTTNGTSAQYDWAGNGIDQLNSDGFRVDGSNSQFNDSLYTYVSWTFRKAAKFFDVVTYTGNGSASRAINHNLGSTPGCVIVKRTDDISRWKVWHRALPTVNGNLNDNSAFDSNVNNMFYQGYISDTSSTTFTVNEASTGVQDVNGNGYSYVAYVFAHDAGGFGNANDKSVIKCGSYTGTGATNNEINLGWEPQWLLIKNTTTGGTGWVMHDNMRGIAFSSVPQLYANVSNAEAATSNINLTPTGFNITDTSTDYNASSTTYIYIAVRRGPMKTPTDATKVFTPTIYTGTNADNRLIDTTIAPDFVMIRQRNDTVVPGMYVGARMTAQQYMITGSTAAATTDLDSFDMQVTASAEYGNAFSSMSGVFVGNDTTRKFNYNTASNNHVIHAFKRAPGFFDVVCYTGTGANTTISHNLGVAPELMIIKVRGTAGYNWAVYHSALGNTKYLTLNTTSAEGTSTSTWNSTTPTSSVFSLGTDGFVNNNTTTYIALLFASVSGVSKVGTYTGNGTSQTINCGFTAGARYVLIKRTDNTGDWFVFDTARGITTGSDPQLRLNSTANEDTTEDNVEPDNSGFIVNQNTGSNINVSSATYIYLAIA